MYWLARLLILERARRALSQFGWAGSVSFMIMLAVLGLAAGAGAAGVLGNLPGDRVPTVLNFGWLAWVTAGVLLGKDLTWHLRLERIKVFPVAGFARLYTLAFLLSFVSPPLLVLLLVIAAAGSGTVGWSIATAAMSLAAGVLFASSVRTAVSLLRTLMFHWGRLSAVPRCWGGTAAITLAALGTGATFCSEIASCLPGSQLALFLTSGGNPAAALCLIAFTLLLAAPDYILARCATYSGIGGTVSHGGRIASSGSLLSLHSSWPGPLWRISLLGWLRNRNAVLLLAWGGLYGFFYMYFTQPDETFNYVTFSWMALVFHSYLRGNLLGVDHKAAWAYYMVPLPVQDVIRAKNRTLTLLQGCMVAAVLLPAVVHPVPGVSLPEWVGICVGAYSSLLVGEISGTILSLRYPEPIERSSHFSGGMSTGGLLIPVLQLVFLSTFMVVAVSVLRRVSVGAFWAVLLVVPVTLRTVCSALLPGWARKRFLQDKAVLLARLAVYSS